MEKRIRWAVEYRNWIGQSKHGVLFIRCRKGKGKWRRRLEDIPEYVRTYLGLAQCNPHDKRLVMSGIHKDSDIVNATFARNRISNGVRIYCEIPEGERRKKIRDASPRMVGSYATYTDGPGELYRQLYKYTDCGPSLGVSVVYPNGSRKWLYCDALYGLGTWADMAKRGERITHLSVGSIVEGVDFDCETIEVPVHPLIDLRKRLYGAVEAVNREADYIWSQTHGCPECKTEGEWGHPAINPKCKACKGEGVIL